MRGSVSLQLLLTSGRDAWQPCSPLTVARVLWAVERVLKQCHIVLEHTEPLEAESRLQRRALWLGRPPRPWGHQLSKCKVQRLWPWVEPHEARCWSCILSKEPAGSPGL